MASKIHAHLNFPGNCREAFAYYADLFGGEIVTMTPFSDTPARDHVPPEWKDKIWQATLRLETSEIMATDSPPHMYNQPQGFGITIHVDDPAKAEAVFHSLADGGSISVPLQQNFWAQKFGIVTDRFGTPWIVNCA